MKGASWTHEIGFLQVSNSRATAGGGLAIGNNSTMHQLGGMMHFNHCTAEKDGGGMFLERSALIQREGTLWFQNCEAWRPLPLHSANQQTFQDVELMFKS